MSAHTELTLLREEERVLMKIASKLNDQLNRLKVEELALQSMIRTSKAKEGKIKLEAASKERTSSQPEQMLNARPVLDLNITKSFGNNQEDTLEEEDDDADADPVCCDLDNSQLKAFLEQMELQHGNDSSLK